MTIYLICLLLTSLWIYEFFFKKKYFSVLTYIWSGIIFPLFLYQLGWSDLIDNSNSKMFNYIFIWLTICIIFYFVLSYNDQPHPLEIYDQICITSFGKIILPLLNIGFILLYLIENYIGSRSFIPGLQKIDIHTFSAPIISYLTNMPFVVMVFDYYAYKATKNKRYWLLIITIFFIPVVTRSARMQMMISAVQFISLLFFIELPGAMKNLKAKKNFRRIKRIVIIIGIATIIGLTQFTNYRMNHYGKYNYSFADNIGYTGPKMFEFFAPYYGYFPLSFNNLKINLARPVVHNYIGLYSFNCFYFGILQLDNLLGISVTGNIKDRLITNPSATVPTGFWDFYFDFNYLCFIPMIVAFVICYYFLKKSKKEKKRLTYRTLYFWYIPLWFFMSFQNVIFGSTIIVAGILLSFLIRYSFVIKHFGCF